MICSVPLLFITNRFLGPGILKNVFSNRVLFFIIYLSNIVFDNKRLEDSGTLKKVLYFTV